MTGTLSFRNGRIWVDFTYSEYAVSELKASVYGATYSKKERAWWCGMNVLSVRDAIAFANDHGLEIDDTFKSAVKKSRFRENFYLSSCNDMDDRYGKLYDERLYPFQRATVMYILENKRCIVGDDTGLGKSVTSLVAMREMNCFPLVIVCPAAVKEQWRTQVVKWLGSNITTTVCYTRTASTLDCNIAIVNYAILKDWEKSIVQLKPKGVIFDESQMLRNRSTYRSYAARHIVKDDCVESIVLLSATPLKRVPFELVNQLRTIGKLRSLGGSVGFARRFCYYIDDNGSVAKDGCFNTKDLHLLLRSSVMCRHRKDDVGLQFPPVTHTKVPIAVKNKDEYAAKEADMIQWTQTLGILTKKERLELTGKLRELRRLAYDCKAEVAAEWVRTLIDGSSDDKVIIWAYHHHVQDSLIELFPNAYRVTHGMSRKKINENISKFVGHEGACAMICSMSMAHVGLDLQASNIQVFVELPTSSMDCDQMIGRSDRIAQKKPVGVYYIVALETIDEDIMDTLDSTRRAVGAILDNDADNSRMFSSMKKVNDAHLDELIVDRMLQRRKVKRMKLMHQPTADVVALPERRKQ